MRISRFVRTKLFFIIAGSMLAGGNVNASQHALSPNHRFEAYTIAHYPDGTGMRLFLRAAGSSETGVLLRENERWIETSWSPDSRFLAVIDGSDGHVTDVFVYRVRSSRGTVSKASYASFQALGEVAGFAQARRVVADLWYHTPNPWTYDVQWDVAGWDASRSAILLTKSSREPKPARIRVVLKPPPAYK